MALMLVCEGLVTPSADFAASCSTGWQTMPLGVVAGSQLDPEDFGILFGAVVMFLLIGFAVKQIRQLLAQNANRG